MFLKFLSIIALFGTLVIAEPPVAGGYGSQNGNNLGSSGGYGSTSQYSSNGGYSSGGPAGAGSYDSSRSQFAYNGGRSALSSTYAGRGASTRYTAGAGADTHSSQNTEVTFETGGYSGGGGFASPSGSGGYAAARNGFGGNGGDGGFGGNGGNGGYGGNGATGGYGANGGNGGYSGNGGGDGYGGSGAGNRHDEDANSEPANYEFSYEVDSPEYHVHFGHHENRHGDEANGLYHVLLPDGRTQIVEYKADQDGYKPKVTYQEANNGGDGNGFANKNGNGLDSFGGGVGSGGAGGYGGQGGSNGYSAGPSGGGNGNNDGGGYDISRGGYPTSGGGNGYSGFGGQNDDGSSHSGGAAGYPGLRNGQLKYGQQNSAAEYAAFRSSQLGDSKSGGGESGPY